MDVVKQRRPGKGHNGRGWTMQGLWHWCRQRFLASPLDIILTLAVAWVVWHLGGSVWRWAVADADFIGTTRADCTSGGACWVFVGQRLQQFLYGFYPEAERWRVNLVAALAVANLALLGVDALRRWRGALAGVLLVVLPIVAFVLLSGGWLGLPLVETTNWGGLMLTLIIASVGIVGSLPLGILLALGRRSSLPVVRRLATAFIELWRGVPLITVLFMASVMLPLLLPPGVSVDKLLRALVGVTLFAAAYMAEVVRGGLQSLPQGQYEAAAALGLRYWQTMLLVILPQALRRVIPGIVNTFIGLFKDTTLVLVIGMFDLLGMVQTASTDPEWLGYSLEGYAFAGAVFWVFCFSMSRFSMRVERRYQAQP